MSTQQMSARTMSMTLGAGRPRTATDAMRSTRAARSLAAVDKIEDADARFAAFSRHMSEYPPLIASI
ncbi:hypothetical protein [Microbacterium sp. CR_7]|uniref:hypothetical protein n=1 Tax=Microbacterium sp. CR_7 TaxID=3055792 RepID=UPI0035C1EF09